MEVKMSGKIDQYERAARAWPLLIKSAQKRQIMTYGQLAAQMDLHPRVCRFFLGIIQDYCKENNIPPLQSLVVNQRTGVPGDGYRATGRDNMGSVNEKVFAYPWERIKNPFGSYD
jgi:putative restriction endonuclease